MAILDNAKGVAATADVGIKISKPGYGAKTAADANLVFSSSWPSLTVAFTKQQSYSATNLAIPHGLTFPPFTMAWVIDTTLEQSSYAAPSKGAMRFFPDVDSTNIYIPGGTSAGNNGFQTTSSVIHIKSYNIDLSKDVDYPLLQTTNGFVGAYDSNFGIKLAKPNKTVTSVDLRDYIIHSRCQTPLIMAVKTQATMNPANSQTIQYTNKLGYPSWNYGYTKTSAGRYHNAPFFSQAYPRTNTDGITTSVNWAFTDIGATIVVLRDPLFPTNEVDVSY